MLCTTGVDVVFLTVSSYASVALGPLFELGGLRHGHKQCMSNSHIVQNDSFKYKQKQNKSKKLTKIRQLM